MTAPQLSTGPLRRAGRPARSRRRAYVAASRSARRTGQCLLFGACLLHLGAMSLAWNAVALLIEPFLPAARGVIVGRAAIAWIYRSFWTLAQRLGLMRLDCRELEALDADAGLIVAANHPTMLDAMLLVARLPRGICIMRASLLRNPFLGPASRLARYLSNDEPRAMIRGAVAELQAGGQLVWFPEGTRTVAPPVNPFCPGLARVARLAQVPIQTVLIETTTPYLRKGWPIWRAPRFPVVIRARLGERFVPEADHRGLLLRLEAYFRRELTR